MDVNLLIALFIGALLGYIVARRCLAPGRARPPHTKITAADTSTAADGGRKARQAKAQAEADRAADRDEHCVTDESSDWEASGL